MAIGCFLARSVLGALALAGVSLFAGAADAATLYNFSFVQTGYDNNPVYGLGSNPATLSGTFSGSFDSAGYLDPASLTNYHLTFDYANLPAAYDLSDDSAPFAFSYRLGDNGSLSIIQHLSNGYSACVGFVVGYQCYGGNALGAVIFNFTGVSPLELSSTAPVVTLVSTTLDPPVSATPVPATLPLFISALGGLGLISARRRGAARFPS